MEQRLLKPMMDSNLARKVTKCTRKKNITSTDLCEDFMGQILPMKMSISSYFTCAGGDGIRGGDVALKQITTIL